MAKPKLDSRFVIDELTAVSNGLGKLDDNDGTYMKDRDCKACLREMFRYLTVDGDQHVARTILGSLNVIKSDLVPLIVQYCDFNEGDPELFQTILRICTNLTTDPKVLFENHEAPTDIEDLKVYNKLRSCLYGYKEAFASNDKVWSVLNVHLRHNTEDEVTFERLIILIRNILLIPVDSSGDTGSLDYFDTHDMCIYQMQKCGMLNTFLKMALESENGSQFCFHIMEIIYLILRNQNAETLAAARPVGYKRSQEELDLERRRYKELRSRNERPNITNTKIAPYRFRNTSVTIQNSRSLSSAPLVVSKIPQLNETITYDKGKTELRKSRNRKPLPSETPMMISDNNTRLSKISYSLKLFCREFVEKLYGPYMQQIKHNLIQKKALEDDEGVYLWALQFFNSFNRHMNLSFDNTSETLSTSTLHYVQILTTSYQEKLKVEKKKFLDVSRRLHLALRAYREILLVIRAIEKDPNSPFTSLIQSIKKTLQSELEYSTLLVTLFQQYEEPKHSSHYLADLILTNDIFLGLVPDMATRYCSPDVIRCYCGTLKKFKLNKDSVNVAIVNFLERVSECGRETMLFQASLFKTVLEVIESKTKLPGMDRLTSLGLKLFTNFGAMANKRRWMYQELLFWKAYDDMIQIENAVDPPPEIPEAAEPQGEENVEPAFEPAENESGDELNFLEDDIPQASRPPPRLSESPEAETRNPAEETSSGPIFRPVQNVADDELNFLEDDIPQASRPPSRLFESPDAVVPASVDETSSEPIFRPVQNVAEDELSFLDDEDPQPSRPPPKLSESPDELVQTPADETSSEPIFRPAQNTADDELDFLNDGIKDN